MSDSGCYTPASDSDSESESDPDGPSAATLARFWAKVNKHGPTPIHRPDLGSCWLWTANTVRGYGQFVLPRAEYATQRHVYAHRFALELAIGPLGSSKINACHHCDQPLCVRASHLFAGTQAANLDDARRKGRLVDGLGARHLSDDAYAEILSTPNTRGSGIALARKFGVTRVSISRIRHGKQGSTYRRDQPQTLILERVAHRLLEVRGEVG